MANRIRPSDDVVRANIKKWNIPQPDRQYTVLIHCSTYNHGRYIKYALEGFVRQKCSFPFCAIIIDDCSTDNNVEIIKEYAEKYPDIIKPILLGENHMQRGVLRDPYFEKWHQSAKYIAECEGDDYWTDSLKLQKQYDVMEAHLECSLCFHAHATIFTDGRLETVYPYVTSKIVTPEEVIMIEDGMVVTGSIFYRRSLRDKELPEFWRNCPVGDIPARLFYASKGPFAYINDVMSVYRLATPGSWSGRKKGILEWYHHQLKVIDTFREYDSYTRGRFHRIIKKKIFYLYIEMYGDAARAIIKRILPKRLFLFLKQYRRFVS